MGLVLPGYLRMVTDCFRHSTGSGKKSKKITAGLKNTLTNISYQMVFGKQINIIEVYDLTLCISN